MGRVVPRMDGTAYATRSRRGEKCGILRRAHGRDGVWGALCHAHCGVPELMEQINRLRENHKVIARRRANARRRVFVLRLKI